jgi:pilus assembly protein TadC
MFAASKATQATDALVPSALDVLAACLYSGAPIVQALLAVAAAFGGEIGDLLGGVARRSALGAPPEIAWQSALSDPRWANAARSIVRAHYSGAPLTDVLSRTADERRRELRAIAHAAANKASVRAVLPLGVCFLPAFVLVGIVPVIAGFAGTLWG